MFKDARALDRQRTTARFDQDLQRYADKAEQWFNGSVDSIDQRLAHCKRLLHSVRFSVARLTQTDSARYLRAAEDLNRDLRTLEGVREDLLTGASGREDVTALPGRRTASKTPAGGNALNGADRRWVELESARFLSTNTDTLDNPRELAIRAAHHAELKTSVFSPARSAAVTRVFVAKVTELGRQAYRPAPRTARAPVVFDVAPEAMFL
jgi:hypothetical protein